LWAEFAIPIVDDDVSYHVPQLIPRVGRLLIRQPFVDYGVRQDKSRNGYLYKDYDNNLSVLFDVRSQTVSGSTDQKLLDILEGLAGSEYADCWMVIYGKGARKTVQIRVQSKARELSTSNKRIKVINAIGNVLHRQISNLIQFGRLQGS
jgi:hypothetical protein